MYTVFTRKPRDLEEVAQNMQYVEDQVTVRITEEIELDPAAYEYFWHNPCADHDFLKGKGGYRERERTAVLLTCGDRKRIIVDPSGAAYGRYVGLEI